MSEIYVITITDKNNISKTKNLRKTVGNIYNIEILETYDIKMGNKSKIIKIYEYLLMVNKIKENDIICIVDGFDILYNKNRENRLLYDFKRENADIIISSETRFAHHNNNAKEYFDEMGKEYINRYPNSGMMIGYKYAYKKMFKDIIENMNIENEKSDQKIISKYMKEKREMMIKIDYQNIFCTTVNTEYKKDIDKITSYFVHITNMGKEYQMLKYKKLCSKLIDE